MKQFASIFLLSALLVAGTRGQSPEYYEFSQNVSAPYESLQGASVLPASEEVKGTAFKTTFFDEEGSISHSSGTSKMKGVDIGFDFLFAGKTYDKFVAGGVGFIVLGEKEEDSVVVNGSGMMCYGWYPTVGIGTNQEVYGVDATSIAYKTEGTEGNRVLSVEYTGIAYEETPSATFNYQIKLYEEGNRIELVFDQYTLPSTATYPYGVGIEAANGIHHRAPSGGKWENSTLASSGWATGLAGSVFAEGLTYTFTPPAACEPPTRQIESLDLAATDASVEISIALAEEGDADSYIVLASREPFTSLALDGSEYDAGDEVDGAIVVETGALGASTEITLSHDEGLDANQLWYYAACLYNNRCSYARYGTLETASVKTATLPPAALDVTEVTESMIKFSISANEWDEEVLVALTDSVKSTSAYSYGGYFGSPWSGIGLGDSLATAEGISGGRVIYQGPAGEDIVCELPLQDNRVYFLAAFSQTEEGGFSASFVEADTITPAGIPFREDFSSMVQYSAPMGWTGTTGFQVLYDQQRNVVAASLPENPDREIKESVLVFPPLDMPEDADVRLRYNYVHYYNTNYGRGGMDASRWSEVDSIVFELSRDHGASYGILHAVTHLDADNFSNYDAYMEKVLDIKGFRGVEDALLRIRFVSSFAEQNYLEFDWFELEPIGECDYPAMVAVDEASVEGDRVDVRWSGGTSGEKAWNLAYAAQDLDGNWGAWQDEGEVSGSTYVLEGLETNKVYKVRMQAVCGVGQVSDWVESESFRSGWTPSFLEDFGHLDGLFSGNWQYGWKLPAYWSAKVHSATHEPESLTFSAMNEINQPVYNWKSGRNSTVIPGETNPALAYNSIQGFTILRLPEIEIRQEESPLFSFDLAFGELVDDKFQTMDPEADAYEKMYVWVSKDGENFVLDSAVLSYEYADLAEMGDSSRVELDLSEYDGKVYLAIGFMSYASNTIFYIDNVGLYHQCPSARYLELEPGGLTENSAVLRWRDDLSADSWTLRLEGGGESSEMDVDGNRVELTGLQAATSYLAKLGLACADTSTWSRISFTTGGTPCAEPEGLAISAIGSGSATLSFQGEASRYRIRIRPVGSSEWVYYETTQTQYVFNNLLAATQYEGGVQSVCGQAVGDTSAYVAFESFTTTEVSCFAPGDLHLESAEHFSVTLAWSGDAGNWQVECRTEASYESLGLTSSNMTSCVVEGLMPETAYQARIRSICSQGDTSAWSDWMSFRTAVAPECPVPSDLNAEVLSPESALLSWECAEEGASFLLRFSQASPLSWDSVPQEIEATSWQLEGLEPETVYLWAVMSLCVGDRSSDWSGRERFETKPSANEAGEIGAAFRCHAAQGQLHVLNPSGLPVDRILIHGMDGRLLRSYAVRSTDNVLVSTGLEPQVVVVLIESAGEVYRYKILLR